MDNILARKIQLRHNIDPCKPTGSTSMQGRKNTETVRGPRFEVRGPRNLRGPRSEVRGSRFEVRGKGQSGETNFFSEQTSFFFQDVSVLFLPCMDVEPVGLHGSMLCLSWIFLAKMLSIPRLHVGSMLDLPP